MAQNVNTPRFYVSWGDYFKALGYAVHPIMTLNPSQGITQTTVTSELTYDVFGAPYKATVPANLNKGANFVACLGHNLGGYDIICKRHQTTLIGANQEFFGSGMGDATTQVNYESTMYIPEDGWSIRVGSDTGWNSDFSESEQGGMEDIHVGWRPDSGTFGQAATGGFSCMVYGRKYDMPHSPDLNLKLSYEYDGVKTIQTKGGATLSNASYTKPADWGNGGGAWQLGGVSNLRSGRRVWDLSFSYLSDTDVMPNLGVQNYEDSAIESGTEDILTGTDFFSSVWNKTMGGHLPFIFQPDGSNADPKADGFAICRFDMNSLTYDQVANNVYNVKLKIRECW